MQDTSHAHREIFAPFLFFTLREEIYFLGGSRGWIDGLFAFSDKRWVRKRGGFRLTWKHCNTWLAPAERSLFSRLSVPWAEVNQSKSKRLGRAAGFPLPAPSGCPSLPVSWECLCSAVEGRMLGPLGSSVARQTRGKKGGNELFKRKLTEKAWQGKKKIRCKREREIQSERVRMD